MTYQMADLGHLGSHPFNHQQSQDAEKEYDRLRDLARREGGKRQSCYERRLFEEGKKHGAQMDAYNKQASDFIFRENNAESRVPSDTIDLHGQYVEEAEEILEQRIRYAQSTGQTHLHVIVGRGNHSPHHVQKLKPRVERLCQELGLQFHTEANEGRIYVNLSGGPADAPPPTHVAGTLYGGNAGYPGNQPGHTPQQDQGVHSPHGQAHGHKDDQVEKVVKKFLPKVIRKLERQCCIVM